MWHILKAEASYNKGKLRAAIGPSVLWLIVGLTFDVFLSFALLIITFIVYFIAVGLIRSTSSREGRDRFHAQLPLPIKRLGAGRLLFLVFAQGAMLLLWLTLVLIKHPDPTTSVLWGMLSANGMLLMVIAVIVLLRDLHFHPKRRFRYLIYAVLGVSLLLFPQMQVSNHGLTSDGSLWKFAISPSGSVVFSLIALGLLLVSFNIFIKRNSFLR